MRTLRVYVSTNRVGSRCEAEIEVEDDATDDEIEETARDAMFNLIEWGYEPAEPAAPRRRAR